MSSSTPTKPPQRASSIKVGLGQLVVSKSPGDVLSVRVADATIAATVDAVHPLGPADASRPPEPSTAGGAP